MKVLFPLFLTALLLLSCRGGGGDSDNHGSESDNHGSEKEITAFFFNGLDHPSTGLINGMEIAVSVPSGTDISVLTASFSTTGSLVRVNGREQLSGTTVNDFSSPVIYSVYAEDGSSQSYEVTVSVAENRGSRLLGYDLVDYCESGSFDANMTMALAMESGFIPLHLYWSAIETSAGVYQDPGGALGILSAIAAAYGIKMALVISPVDLPGRCTPSYLSGVSFGNTTMITAFEGCLDYILSIVDPTLLTSLSVGNEIDGYDWTGNGDSPADYATFLFNIEEHLDGYGVKTAFTGTLEGLCSGSLRDLGTWTAMATVVDAIHVTYYPMDMRFKVHSPDSAYDDLEDLMTEFDGINGADGGQIPIYMQEVGYHSASYCGSSESMQEEFFYHFFLAWDRWRDRIPQASFLRLCDVSRNKAESTADDYHVSGNEGFIEYIRTLGLRTYDGTGSNKAAVATIAEELVKRNW